MSSLLFCRFMTCGAEDGELSDTEPLDAEESAKEEEEEVEEKVEED